MHPLAAAVGAKALAEKYRLVRDKIMGTRTWHCHHPLRAPANQACDAEEVPNPGHSSMNHSISDLVEYHRDAVISDGIPNVLYSSEVRRQSNRGYGFRQHSDFYIPIDLPDTTLYGASCYDKDGVQVLPRSLGGGVRFCPHDTKHDSSKLWKGFVSWQSSVNEIAGLALCDCTTCKGKRMPNRAAGEKNQAAKELSADYIWHHTGRERAIYLQMLDSYKRRFPELEEAYHSYLVYTLSRGAALQYQDDDFINLHLPNVLGSYHSFCCVTGHVPGAAIPDQIHDFVAILGWHQPEDTMGKPIADHPILRQILQGLFPSNIRTQKAKGIIASTLFGYEVTNQYGEIFANKHSYIVTSPEELLTYAERVFPRPENAIDLFFRPCPLVPRHGWVDSRICKSVSDVQELVKEIHEQSPSDWPFEVVVAPAMKGDNIVYTPGSISWGKGTDGATGGESTGVLMETQVIDAVFNKGFGFDKAVCSDLIGFDLDESWPYLEVVKSNDVLFVQRPGSIPTIDCEFNDDGYWDLGPNGEKVFTLERPELFYSVPKIGIEEKKSYLVQIRGGPKLQSSSGDVIPGRVEVKDVINPAGLVRMGKQSPIFDWENLVEETKGKEGVVANLPNQTLASHYAIHALVHGLPVVTSREVQAGDVLEPTNSQTGVMNWDDATIRDVAERVYYHLTRSEYTPRSLGLMLPGHIGFIHSAGVINPNPLEVSAIGEAFATILRGAVAACIGEARYASRFHKYRKEDFNVKTPLMESEYFETALKLVYSGPDGANNRDTIYKYALKNDFFLNFYPLRVANYLFTHMNWSAQGGGIGGAAWAVCTEHTLSLFKAVVRFIRYPRREHLGACLAAANNVIHASHNNARLLTKFVTNLAFDHAAKDPGTLIGNFMPLMEESRSRAEGKIEPVGAKHSKELIRAYSFHKKGSWVPDVMSRPASLLTLRHLRAPTRNIKYAKAARAYTTGYFSLSYGLARDLAAANRSLKDELTAPTGIFRPRHNYIMFLGVSKQAVLNYVETKKKAEEEGKLNSTALPVVYPSQLATLKLSRCSMRSRAWLAESLMCIDDAGNTTKINSFLSNKFGGRIHHPSFLSKPYYMTGAFARILVPFQDGEKTPAQLVALDGKVRIEMSWANLHEYNTLITQFHQAAGVEIAVTTMPPKVMSFAPPYGMHEVKEEEEAA